MTGAAKIFSQIRLREVKGLKDRTSYLCTYANNFTLLSLTDKAFFVVFFHYLHSKFK
ncbi:hypothetical protein [Klebsiella pneumoniae IS10]|nr:hypothetical protein [Klebsiella pneumoniae IS10]